MEKRDHYKKISNLLNKPKNIEIDKIKTTNVNILLNRVRLDQKKTFKKRVLFSFFLLISILFLTVYFVD